MTNYSHIAHRVFNRPHLVDPTYARIFVGALSDRLDIRSLALPDGTRIERPQLRSAANDFEPGRRSIVDSVDGIAIIPIEGTLVHKYGHVDPYSGATGYDGIQAKLEEALDDSSIRGVLLDINSPGGEVSGAFDLTDFIYEARGKKAIWALADEWAASAAYSLASAADRVIAPRTAELGSVGVLTMHVDQSQMIEEAGLDVTFIFAGDHKVDGNPFEPLPDDVRADIQEEIDYTYSLFVSTVARNRGMSEDAVRNTEARVYNARDAREIGFSDDVMAAHDVLPTFDEYLRQKQGRSTVNTIARGVQKMSLTKLFGQGREAKTKETATKAEALEAELARQRGEAEEPETPEQEEEPEEAVAAEEPEGEQDPEGEDVDQAASAETIVALCTEARVPQLANNLIRSGSGLSEVKARIQDARDMRDACAAAGVPHLADKAVEAIDQQRFADLMRSALTELTANASGEEVSHHQPTTQVTGRKASLNTVQYYQQKR